MNRCSAKNRSGVRCRGFAVAGSSFCFWHDPRNAHKRQDARRRGGRHSRTRATPSLVLPADLKSVDGLLVFIESLIGETLKLHNSTHRSRALASLALAQKRIIELRTAEKQEQHTRLLSLLQNTRGLFGYVGHDQEKQVG
jgi:hypothetical protein